MVATAAMVTYYLIPARSALAVERDPPGHALAVREFQGIPSPSEEDIRAATFIPLYCTIDRLVRLALKDGYRWVESTSMPTVTARCGTCPRSSTPGRSALLGQDRRP